MMNDDPDIANLTGSQLTTDALRMRYSCRKKISTQENVNARNPGSAKTIIAIKGLLNEPTIQPILSWTNDIDQQNDCGVHSEERMHSDRRNKSRQLHAMGS